MSLKKIIQFLIGLILFILPLVSIPAQTVSSDQEETRILLISSYHPSFPTFFQQINGIQEAFKETEIILDIEFMDSKRFFTNENQNLFFERLREKLEQLPPYDGIIASDDNAFQLVLAHQNDFFLQIPIVFCGVNNIEAAKAQNDNPWVTGVTEAVSMSETIELILSLRPNTKNITAIVDETTSGLADLDHFYSKADLFQEIEFETLSLKDHTFKEVEEILSVSYKEKSFLLISAYRDYTGAAYNFEESLSMLTERSNNPLFHLYEHGIGEGLIGGKVISHFQQGFFAGNIIKEILLKDLDPSSIPVIKESPNTFLVDAEILDQYGIPLRLLPEETTILNPPAESWTRFIPYVGLFLAIILFETGLIFLLYHSRKRLKLALSEKEILLREVHHRVKNNLAMIDSFLNLQMGKYPGDKCQQLNKEIKARIRAISLVHEMTYKSSDIKNIPLKDYLDRLIHQLLTLSPDTPPRVNFRGEFPPDYLTLEKIIPLGLLFTELVINAQKHAFAGHPDPVIDIIFSSQPQPVIIIKDNGSGLPRDIIDQDNQQLGLQLILLFAEQIEAEAVFSNEQGCQLTLTFSYKDNK